MTLSLHFTTTTLPCPANRLGSASIVRAYKSEQRDWAEAALVNGVGS
jgi:hypothetical protein